MIPVTKTFLPNQSEYNEILERAWSNAWLTNNGELLQELVNKLKDKLGVNFLIPTTNGTLPLQIAIKALALEGEIITTPFSYVATTSSIVWENCKAVFVDIDPFKWTIDEKKIEEKINENTTAILATHVFGNPCNIEAIQSLADKYQLKVIYDAAHCFGVKYRNKSLFNYGDISTCSFHATKIFHTAEGGGLFCQDKEVYDKCYYHHNFGHKGQEDYYGLGINAKMSELQAAMGLAVLPYIDEIIMKRSHIYERYHSELKDIFQFIHFREETTKNYSYCPILFQDENQLLHYKKKLEDSKVYCRRYFYPSLNTLPYIDSVSMPKAEMISKRILCLPIFVGLSKDEQSLIIKILKS